MPTAAKFRRSRIRIGLDATITMLCILGISWYFVVGPIFMLSKDIPTLLVAVSYPFWDVLLILAILLLVFQRTEPVLHSSLLMFGLAIISQIIADTGYALTIPFGTYTTGTPYIDTFWFCGFLLIGLAAPYQYAAIARRVYYERRLSGPEANGIENLVLLREEKSQQRNRVAQTLLIYISLILLLTFTLLGEIRGQNNVFLVALTAIVGLLVTARYLLVPEHPLPSPLKSDSQVQVARTIPGHTYSFAPKTGIQGIAQLYAHALSNAQRYIYLENQYFWTHALYGIDHSFLGTDSPDMERNLRELEAALLRGVTVALILPDHPNMGRAFTDAALNRLRQAAPEAVKEGRLQVFCLATSTTLDGSEHYQPIYVHAKVAIIDDLWSTVGSANLNNRGMRDDTEMNVATLDAELAVGLRMMLLAEHVGLMNEEDLLTVSRHLGSQRQAQSADQRAVILLRQLLSTMDNPLIGLQMMIDCAQDNLRRFKAKQPLVGHLLPYLTAVEAKQHGLHFREAHGWVELTG
jgi:PLD-like domain